MAADPASALSQFLAITNSEPSQAQLLLESTQYNVEQAVALFFQLSEDSSLPGSLSAAPLRIPAARRPHDEWVGRVCGAGFCAILGTLAT